MLELPLRWKKPQTIFVNSMSDLFHEKVPQDFIMRIFDVMNRANWHRFQILTKRSERLLKMNPELNWAPNIWMGVTVENQACATRIEHLRKTDAHVKFLSMEPLLGAVSHLKLRGIDWVIAGGESGPGARPMEKEWVTGIRDACLDNDVPFFFKQWGGVRKKEAGRRLEGKLWSQMPEVPAVNQPLELAFA
jgi:protein gp37